MNNINGGTLRYTQADFDRYLSGARRTDNWNDLIIAKWSPQTQHDVTISGGSEKATYYVSFGYLYQEGIFKSGDLNYNKYNLRSNVTAELLRGLRDARAKFVEPPQRQISRYDSAREGERRTAAHCCDVACVAVYELSPREARVGRSVEMPPEYHGVGSGKHVAPAELFGAD